MDEKDLIKLVMEAGVLSRTPRTGPYHVGLTNHETIASHSYRHMVLAYFIAKEEGADTGKVLKMGLVKDLPESRTLDLTFIQKKYIDVDESGVLKDQLRGLDGEELNKLFNEFKKCKTTEAKVTSDADILEALIEAKEFIQQGIKIMDKWFLDKRDKLKTETGKRIFDLLEKETIYWWK